MQHFFEESEGTHGYRRIHADLQPEETECSPELVRQIMRREDPVPCQPRPFRTTTVADAEAAIAIPDLVQRDFAAVAAELGTPRSSLYRSAEARALIADRLTEERVNVARNQAAEVHRLGLLIDALSGRGRSHEERLRQLEGRPNTTLR